MSERETLYIKAKRFEYVGLVLAVVGAVSYCIYLGIAATLPLIYLTSDAAKVLFVFWFVNIICGLICFEYADKLWEKRVCL